MRINVGLAQIYPKLGDVCANLDKHLAFVEQAAEQHVELLVFPELSMSGYQVQDLVPEVAIRTEESDKTFAALLKASKQLDIVVGFVHEDHRKRFYIADAYLSGGECLHIHHKLYLPTYAMFDEGRYFARGNTARAFDTRYGRVGMLICEDFWHVSPAYVLWMDGADIMIFNSSSPGRGLDSEDRLSGTRWVELVNQAYGSMFTSYILHCNRVGYEDGKNFWGGSSIVDPNGEFLQHGIYFDETLIAQEIDLNQLHRTRARLPLLRDERPGLVKRELERVLAERLSYPNGR
ncbi:MAG: carbon-nitrogen hydrolase [Chloroflexi bacterium]|nr:MAG: carbon-nitrogen hydrolase [Chloroflexota bacterium]